MKALNVAILVVAALFLCAVTFTICTGTEQCLDGHAEFSGRACP